MKINKKIICGVLCLSYFGLGSISANVMQIHFNEDKPMIETKLTAIDKITFTDTSFSIHFDSSSHLTDVASVHYAYGEVEKITFSDINSIENIGKEENVKLMISPNPVDNIIRIVGYNNSEPAQLSIYSLNGEEVMRIENWQGETIDASPLSAGIYILRINTTTIKFIKS